MLKITGIRMSMLRSMWSVAAGATTGGMAIIGMREILIANGVSSMMNMTGGGSTGAVGMIDP